MKRKKCEITDPAALDKVLLRCRIGRMATTGTDGYPYITPVNYVYHDRTIYFHCARAGEKLDNIRNDARVCFEVDIPLAYLDCGYYGENPEACSVHQFYHCVLVRGTAEIVNDQREKLEALNALVASHEGPGKRFQPITEETPAVSLCEVVAIRIERISGKSDLAQGKDKTTRQQISEYLEKRGLAGDDEAGRLVAGK